tara:strand:- start:4186 stop:4704 length:519 start_codon:yes stop_codon:yes gene_type:complete
MPGHYHNKRSSLLGKQPKPSARTVKERKVIRNLIKTGASKGKSTPALMRLLAGGSNRFRRPMMAIQNVDNKGPNSTDPKVFEQRKAQRASTWSKQTRAGRAVRSVSAGAAMKTRQNIHKWNKENPNRRTGPSAGAKPSSTTGKPSVSKALRVAGPLGVALTIFDFLKGKPAH